MPKGAKGHGRQTGGVASGSLIANTPDFFGGLAQDELVVDFREVHPSAIHSIISRVCVAGGYISFASPGGGEAIKLSVSVGGNSGHRWIRSGQELAAYVAYVHNALQAIESRRVVAVDVEGGGKEVESNTSDP